MRKRTRVPMPSSLYVLDPAWVEQCKHEGPHDCRHLGRYLIYEYKCPNCGVKYFPYEPDYGYCGPNSIATCPACYAVMELVSPVPVIGKPRRVAWDQMPVRKSV